MVKRSSLSIYFPNLPAASLVDSTLIKCLGTNLEVRPHSKDWQQEFLTQIGLRNFEIPWNKLRALKIGIDKTIRTAVCCDPVIMQMTHRGAYLWGQQLDYSHEEINRIVAKINQQLMGVDENLYLLDSNRWLYTNKKALDLQQSSFENYIGKDMFGFSYTGEDRVFWNKLATEIQMLIKQMTDYQGLTKTAPEMIANVHFWGNTDLDLATPLFSQIKNYRELEIISDDVLIDTFCQGGQIQYRALENYFELNKQNGNSSESGNTVNQLIMVLSKTNLEELENNLSVTITSWKKKQHSTIKFISQDKTFQIKSNKSYWSKIRDIFKKNN